MALAVSRRRASCSALVGRPRRGRSALDGSRTAAGGVVATWAPSQCSTSSKRHRRRLVPGRRQMGGSDWGLRVASLRMLATDLWMQVESSSTVSNLFMGVTVRSRPTKGLNRVRMSPRDRTLDRSPSGITWSEFGGVVPLVAFPALPNCSPLNTPASS